MGMPLLNEKLFTVEDVYELPEGERAELIDGKFYLMVPPGAETSGDCWRFVWGDSRVY